jgi:hypothetical protein
MRLNTETVQPSAFVPVFQFLSNLNTRQLTGILFTQASAWQNDDVVVVETNKSTL